MATFVSDTFSGRTAGAALEGTSGEAGGPWVAHALSAAPWKVTAAGRAYRGDASYLLCISLATGAPASADYDVEATFVFRSFLNDEYDGICGRFDSTAMTGYMLQYESYTGYMRWRLRKSVAGTYTVLGTPYAHTPTVDQAYTVKLEMRGTAVKVYLDTTVIISGTDSDVTGAGSAGLFGFGSDYPYAPAGTHIDNFTATDAGGTIAPISMYYSRLRARA
jgi:hypothetical protein